MKDREVKTVVCDKVECVCMYVCTYVCTYVCMCVTKLPVKDAACER